MERMLISELWKSIQRYQVTRRLDAVMHDAIWRETKESKWIHGVE